MFKGFLLGIVVTISTLIVVGYIALQFGLIPANADAQPPALEQWAANTSLTATLQREAPQGPSPVQLTDQTLIDGVHLYAQHCAICHGTARGDASASPIARGEYPAPPQLASAGVEDDPPSYTFWKLKHGIRWTAMPSWKTTLSVRQMWTLALFLKHMNKLPPAAEKAWQQVKNGTEPSKPVNSGTPPPQASTPGPSVPSATSSG